MTKPKYIERGGAVVLRQPFRQSTTTLYAFPVEAEVGALEALCDRYLNLGGERVYRPLDGTAIVIAADIREIRSLDAEDANKGWMPERDVAFWVPVVGRERLAWFLPYIFVDNMAAMATGREIYGFPKEQAAISMPRGPADEIRVTVDAMVLAKYGFETKAEVRRVLEVASSRAEETLVERAWTTIADAARELRALLPRASLELLGNVALDLLHERLTLVFLKQFRDATDATRACYQAVVEAPSTVTSFRGGGFLRGAFDVAIEPYDSAPIARELGLAGARVTCERGVFLEFDFDVGPGIEVFRA